MSINNDQRREALATSTPEIHDLYISDALVQKIKLHSMDLDKTSHHELVLTIGDVILGFYTVTELPSLLQTRAGFSADAAQRTTADFLELLSPVLEREERAKLIEQQAGQTLATTIETGHTKRATETAAEHTPAAPLTPQTPSPDRVHGYGAYRQQYRYGDEPEKSQPTTSAAPAAEKPDALPSTDQDQLLSQ